MSQKVQTTKNVWVSKDEILSKLNLKGALADAGVTIDDLISCNIASDNSFIEFVFTSKLTDVPSG